MKLSTKGRYGLRAFIDLAVCGESQPVPLASIAQRQEISVSYLEQLMAKLKKAGLVKSVRGVNGGYSIARPVSGNALMTVLTRPWTVSISENLCRKARTAEQ